MNSEFEVLLGATLLMSVHESFKLANQLFKLKLHFLFL